MSVEAITKPVITKNSSEFKPDAYAFIPTGELVVLAVAILQADASPVAVEEVVSTCFRLFPHSFALKNYFYWPDSALVTRRLHDAKEKGLIKGSPAEGFELKSKGRPVAKRTARSLGAALPVPPKVEVPAPPPVEKNEEPPTKVEEKIEAPVIQVVEEKKEEPKKPAAKKRGRPVTKPKPKPKKSAKEKKETKPTAIKPAAVKAKVKPKKEELAKKAVPVPVKKQLPSKPETSPAKKVKPAAKPSPRKKTPVKKEQIKPVVKPAEKVKKPKAKPLPKPKVESAKVKVKPAQKVKAESIKQVIKPKAKVEKAKSPEAKNAQPKQLTLALTQPAEWKKAKVPAAKPKVRVEASLTGNKKPVKVDVLTPAAVSKGERNKAAKAVKQLERSDAYQLYKRNGRRTQIGEFDFRNMLFATMESSPETLKRNLELFKRYAGIHFRTDLIAFLEFCEEHFADLMKSRAKLKR